MPLPPPQTREFTDRLVAVATECRAELEEASQALQEIALLINQSRGEVERFTQRELQLTNRVREMEANLEAYARVDIRDMYRSAHEVALRLMIMRSQVEQLEDREKSLRTYQEKLRLLIEIADSQAQTDHLRNGGTGRLKRRQGEQSNGSVEIPFAEIIEAQEDERLRVAQLIVDGPAQMLANIALEIEICRQMLERDPSRASDELEDLRRMSSKALRDTRLTLFELRPLVLREIGLVATLRRYVSEVARLQQLQGNVIGPESDDRLPEILRAPLYRLLQQMISAFAALDQVTQIDVDIRYEDAQIQGRVEARGDDLTERQEIHRFLQQETLRNRVQQLDADLQVEFVPGTARLTVVIPLG